MKNISLLIFILVLSSCQNIEKTPKPKVLLSEEQMVDVIFDIALVDAAKRLNYRNVNIDTVDIKYAIYEKHGVDSLILSQNITYYTEFQKINKAIYDSVSNRLGLLKDSVSKLSSTKGLEKDSIKEDKSIKFPADNLLDGMPDELKKESDQEN